MTAQPHAVPHSHDSTRAAAFARARRDAQQWRDCFHPAGKHAPSVCTQCGATQWQGRWRWDQPPPDLVKVLCPACTRLRSGIAAHVVEIAGNFGLWWEEIRGILGNTERAEVQQHPLERLMPLEVRDDRVLVPTTGLHVARRVVAALVRRFRRAVRVRFDDGVTRVEWLPQQ